MSHSRASELSDQRARCLPCQLLDEVVFTHSWFVQMRAPNRTPIEEVLFPQAVHYRHDRGIGPWCAAGHSGQHVPYRHLAAIPEDAHHERLERSEVVLDYPPIHVHWIALLGRPSIAL